MSEAVATPRIRLDRDELHIDFPRLFGKRADKSKSRDFVRRTFVFPEVKSLRLEPAEGKAVVLFQTAKADRAVFLAALAAAIGDSGKGVEDSCLPPWEASEPVALHRFGELASLFEISGKPPKQLQLSHPALASDPSLGPRIQEAVAGAPGVRKVSTGLLADKISIACDPGLVDITRVIRAAEACLSGPGTAMASIGPAPTRMGFANATLGLAAVGELAVPGVLPVCIGMLVVSNLDTIREAGGQLSRGKLGLPVLYTALLGCSITTGQIVAHALMDWSFRFWERRSNAVLAEQTRAMLEENLPLPGEARLVRSDEVDALVPTDLLRSGHRIRLAGREAIPVDGRVSAGSALVDETAVSGNRSPVRKNVGDEVYAGSTLLAGSVEVEVRRTGAQTRAAEIAQTLIETARRLPKDATLRGKARAMADRAVPPTLAIAGVGWAVGGLFTVGAVLHQDHASGPNLTLPLETLNGMKLALGGGAVVRSGSALLRLAESRFVVLDDHPAWSLPGVELESMHSRLAESQKNNLLAYVAGAGLYLGDGRADALANACAALGLVVRQPQLVSLDAGKVSVRQGEHTVILRDEAETEEGSLPSLTVEIDGEEVARFAFRQSRQPRAAQSVARLRQQGYQVFLLSSRPQQETEKLARSLGADLFGGEFNREEKIRFLQGLDKRGVRATHIGNGSIDPDLANQSHVAVSMGGASGLASEETDIVVLGDSLDAFAELTELAQGYDRKIRQTCRLALLPNFLCIAGGYAGVLNGITSGLIANVGVNRVYQQAAKSARESQRATGLGRLGA